MRYQEGLHGIFRASEFKPGTVQVRTAEYEFRKEHPDVMRVTLKDRVFIGTIVFCVIAAVVALVLHAENLAMLIVGVTLILLGIGHYISKTSPSVPRPDKNPLGWSIILCASGLVIAIYNILCMVGKLGNSIDNATALGVVLGVVGVGVFLNELIHGIRMNAKCTETTYATCIGYSDKIKSSDSEHHHRSIVVSSCVYEFEHEGEKYYVIDPRTTNIAALLTPLYAKKKIRFDPNNPEFCMIKNFELAAFIKAILIGGICCLLSFNILQSNLKATINREEPTPMPSIWVPDEDGNIVPAEVTNSTEATTVEATETTKETEPEILGYTDEMLNETLGTDEYLIYTYEVQLAENGFAYLGKVPGLPIDVLNNPDLKVGDRLMIIVLKDQALKYYVLNDGEEYLGDHTVADYGWLTDDGKIILTDDFIKFFFGSGYGESEMVFSFKDEEAGIVRFETEDYLIDYSLVEGTSLYYWDLEPGTVFYVFQNSKNSYFINSELYVYPEE